MNRPNDINWTPQDIRNFQIWEKTEQELAEARKESRKAEETKRAVERISFRRWIKDPLGRKWRKEISEARTRLADAEGRLKALSLRISEIRVGLIERMAQILEQAGENQSHFKGRRWLKQMENLSLDLEDLVGRGLIAVGKARNTVVHSYDRTRNSYPVGVISLLRNTTESVGYLKRKITEYETLLGHDDGVKAVKEEEPFPPAPSNFPMANLDGLETRPVGVNARELNRLREEIEQLGNEFLPALQKILEATSKHREENFQRRLSKRLETERLQIRNKETS